MKNSISYAENKEFISDVIDSTLLEQSIDWIQGRYRPDEIYTDKELALWAEENGYTKESE